jgi:uncharacterized membrane protein YbaN (DUF454 family)
MRLPFAAIWEKRRNSERQTFIGQRLCGQKALDWDESGTFARAVKARCVLRLLARMRHSKLS